MTKQLTNPLQRPLRDVIADDSYVMAFQTVGHYRKALLQHADALIAQQKEVAAAELSHAANLDDSQGEHA